MISNTQTFSIIPKPQGNISIHSDTTCDQNEKHCLPLRAHGGSESKPESAGQPQFRGRFAGHVGKQRFSHGTSEWRHRGR